MFNIVFEFLELRPNVFEAIEDAFVFHCIVSLSLANILDDLLQVGVVNQLLIYIM